MATAADTPMANSSAPLPGGETRTALPTLGTNTGSSGSVPTTGQLWPRTKQG